MSLLVVLISAVSCQKQNKEYDAKITDLESRIKFFEEKVDTGFYRDEKIEVVIKSHEDSQDLFKETMDYYSLHGRLKTNAEKKDQFSEVQNEKMNGLIERIRLVTHYLDSLSESKLRELEAKLPA
jgi:hypothetical protein